MSTSLSSWRFVCAATAALLLCAAAGVDARLLKSTSSGTEDEKRLTNVKVFDRGVEIIGERVFHVFEAAYFSRYSSSPIAVRQIFVSKVFRFNTARSRAEYCAQTVPPPPPPLPRRLAKDSGRYDILIDDTNNTDDRIGDTESRIPSYESCFHLK
jgi:hypothetical protein